MCVRGWGARTVWLNQQLIIWCAKEETTKWNQFITANERKIRNKLCFACTHNFLFISIISIIHIFLSLQTNFKGNYQTWFLFFCSFRNLSIANSGWLQHMNACARSQVEEGQYRYIRHICTRFVRCLAQIMIGWPHNETIWHNGRGDTVLCDLPCPKCSTTHHLLMNKNEIQKSLPIATMPTASQFVYFLVVGFHLMAHIINCSILWSKMVWSRGKRQYQINKIERWHCALHSISHKTHITTHKLTTIR